jgi:Sec-independent protein translocase protein TatA
MAQAEALTNLGNDLAFSVSFAIARELRDEAVSSDISQSQLIAIVTVLLIALDRVPSASESLAKGWQIIRKELAFMLRSSRSEHYEASNAKERRQLLHDHEGSKNSHDAQTQSKEPSDNQSTNSDAAQSDVSKRIVDFFKLFIDISKRICASLLVQLVANAIVAKAPLRIDRIVSLLTITIFFVFLQSGAMFTTSTRL